jgi:hypothetical protein
MRHFVGAARRQWDKTALMRSSGFTMHVPKPVDPAS